ncbi:MAG: hypothetical protein LUC98_07250 [Lachnospiraceae bacterium]|nr:hypothetical protein [Lachnospiraceae bacterium]
MKKKGSKNGKRLLACLVSLCLLVLILAGLTDLVQRKASDYKYQAFFEEEENIDVLFMGTSHVINGIFPMELWKDYGIASYNFGGHSNAIATSYWVMELAMEYSSPSLVVIDCLSLSSNYKTATGYSSVHVSLDAFPLSLKKAEAVMDLLDDEAMDQAIAEGSVEETEERSPLGLLWDFSVYHSRWSELSKDDFEPAAGVEKGAESRIAVAVPNEIVRVPKSEKLEEDTVAVQYLEKMIADCQERGIDVLLVYLPFPASEGQWKDANRVYEIAEEYGVNYINFLDMNIVDFDTDCYDTASHLNPSGARKVTDYLGEYITEHYDLTDHRAEEAYAGWDEDYESYKDYKVKNMKAQTTLDTYLMLLADKNYDVEVELADQRLFDSSYYSRLFANIGVDTALVTEGVSLLKITAAGQDVAYCSADIDIEGDLRFTVTDRETGEVVDIVDFYLMIDPEAEEPVVQTEGKHG